MPREIYTKKLVAIRKILSGSDYSPGTTFYRDTRAALMTLTLEELLVLDCILESKISAIRSQSVLSQPSSESSR